MFQWLSAMAMELCQITFLSQDLRHTVVILHATIAIQPLDRQCNMLDVICASWPEVTNMHFFGDVRR